MLDILENYKIEIDYKVTTKIHLIPAELDCLLI